MIKKSRIPQMGNEATMCGSRLRAKSSHKQVKEGEIALLAASVSTVSMEGKVFNLFAVNEFLISS